MAKEERYNHMLQIIMPQHALKTGLNNLKERGKSAFVKELMKLHVLETFAIVDEKPN